VPIIAENCFQLSVNGDQQGRPWTNVFNVQLLGGTPPDVVDAAALMADAFIETIHTRQSSVCRVLSVSYVDLRTLDGESGTYTLTTPSPGGSGNTPAPPQVALLAKWQASGGRAFRNGRSYICGIPEVQIDSGGLIEAEDLEAWDEQLGEFLTELDTAELGLVVLSGTDTSDVTVRTVTGHAVDARCATQRRRNRS